MPIKYDARIENHRSGSCITLHDQRFSGSRSDHSFDLRLFASPRTNGPHQDEGQQTSLQYAAHSLLSSDWFSFDTQNNAPKKNIAIREKIPLTELSVPLAN